MEIIDQNLLDITAGIIGHQTNCLGFMGAGIALQIKRKYPRVYRQYSKYCDRHRPYPGLLLGTVQPVWADESRKLLVLNLFGQFNISHSRTNVNTDYEALRAIALKLKLRQERGELGPIHLPYGMGCGLGGGDWEVVGRIFRDVDGRWCKLPDRN
ncbi:macro domain-containing protein [Lyngbya sp. CCY1209]|uniref:macro domain-containing protein n=1 Tax=Lyngbya sp. CCY1209 TaxID=2886103 RepID=UPI002D206080|nr:macro domain-containing protein [Lyngbya sp. CCY1209]MEB3884032.1 macro domain-containing protein [Lyngbya sp. CCY1209]